MKFTRHPSRPSRTAVNRRIQSPQGRDMNQRKQSRDSSSRSINMRTIGEKGMCSARGRIDGVSYPEGLRVMAIDSNPVSLLILVTMLRKCQYKVTAQAKATQALEVLWQNKYEFDIVVTAMVGLDMDGFSLLRVISSGLDIPVVIASASDDQQIIKRAVLHGARDFLMKPVRVRVLQNIWQHVVRKQLFEQENNRHVSSDNLTSMKRKFSWTAELHFKFIDAVRQLGINSAHPSRILEIMKVEGLTRRSVSSHLQKHRKKLRKLNAASTQGSQSEFDSSLNARCRRCYDAREVGRARSPLSANQVSNCTTSPSSVNRNVLPSHLSDLQENGPHEQPRQTPWFEQQPSASAFPMINQTTMPDLQGLGFLTAQFEHMQPENQIESHSEYFHFSDPRMGSGFNSRSVDHSHAFPGNGESFNSRNQVANGENRVGNLPPVQALEGNNAQFKHQLSEDSGEGRGMYHHESSYHDDELTFMINRFNVDEAPRL